MAILGERTITPSNRDFLRSVDMENETLLEDGRRGLKVIVDLLEHQDGDADIDLTVLGALLRPLYEKLADVKIGIHLNDL